MTTNDEVWKDVHFFPDLLYSKLYQISDKRRVRKHPDSRDYTHVPPGCVISEDSTRRSVTLHKLGAGNRHSINRIMGLAFPEKEFSNN